MHVTAYTFDLPWHHHDQNEKKRGLVNGPISCSTIESLASNHPQSSQQFDILPSPDDGLMLMTFSLATIIAADCKVDVKSEIAPPINPPAIGAISQRQLRGCSIDIVITGVWVPFFLIGLCSNRWLFLFCLVCIVWSVGFGWPMLVVSQVMMVWSILLLWLIIEMI